MTEAADLIRQYLRNSPDTRIDDGVAADVMAGVSEAVGYDATEEVRSTASEYEEQVALFEWAAYEAGQTPELEMLCASANGGHRHAVVGARMKASGVKAGYPDLALDVPRGPYHGARIELKAKGGKVRDNQRWWLDRLHRQGYFVAVCWGFEEAKETLLWYLRLEVENGKVS